MGMHTKAILDLIAKRPGVRTVEIADLVDCEVPMVEVSIKDQLANGSVIAEEVIAPNGRKTWAYQLRDGSVMPAPTPPLAPLTTPITAKAPAAPKRTKVDLAMDFIRSQPNQQATDAELREVMSLSKDRFPSTFLSTQRANGEIHKDGAHWKLGPAVKATEEQREEIAEVLSADFRCAVWSDGELHLARGEQTMMKLSAREVAQLREYLAVDRLAA